MSGGDLQGLCVFFPELRSRAEIAAPPEIPLWPGLSHSASSELCPAPGSGPSAAAFLGMAGEEPCPWWQGDCQRTALKGC